MSSEVFVHARGLCESDSVGSGTRIWAFAHVMSGARVGHGCNICDHAFIETGAVVGDRVTVKNAVMVWDGVELENDVFVGPGVVFTNVAAPRAQYRKSKDEFVHTIVREGATLGAGSVVVCGVEIGRFALVGAGSVVVRDLPAYALAYGNPARHTGWVCECGNRLDEQLRCRCGRAYAPAVGDAGLEPVAVLG